MTKVKMKTSLFATLVSWLFSGDHTSTAAGALQRYVCFSDPWMDSQCCSKKYGEKGLPLCFQNAAFSFEMCCAVTGGGTGQAQGLEKGLEEDRPPLDSDEQVQLLHLESSEPEKQFPDGCSSFLSWIPMIYAVLLLTSVTYNQVGDVVRNEDREHFLAKQEVPQQGGLGGVTLPLRTEPPEPQQGVSFVEEAAASISATGTTGDEDGRRREASMTSAAAITSSTVAAEDVGETKTQSIDGVATASTASNSATEAGGAALGSSGTSTLDRAAAIENIVLTRVNFSLSHFYRGALNYFKFGKLDLGMMSMLNDILRQFGHAFARCPMVTAAAILLKAHQLGTQDFLAAFEMYDGIVLLVAEAEKAEKIPDTGIWGWNVLTQRFHPVNTRVFLNRTRSDLFSPSSGENSPTGALAPQTQQGRGPGGGDHFEEDALLRGLYAVFPNVPDEKTEMGSAGRVVPLQIRNVEVVRERQTGTSGALAYFDGDRNLLTYSAAFGFAERLTLLPRPVADGRSLLRTRPSTSRTTRSSGLSSTISISSRALSSFTGYRRGNDTDQSVVSLADGRFVTLVHKPTVDVVIPYCCEGFLDLDFARGPGEGIEEVGTSTESRAFRVFLYDICGCDSAKLQDLDGVRGKFEVIVVDGEQDQDHGQQQNKVLKNRSTNSSAQQEDHHYNDAGSSGPLPTLYFDNSLTEAVPSGEIVAYFFHLYKHYHSLSDVTLFLHPDYQEHIREALFERTLHALKGNYTWDFNLHFMYLGWRHESPAIDGRVGPHWSRHCPHYATKSGQPLFPCRFDEWAYGNVIRRRRHDVVGDYNPELLRRIWQILFQEEFDSRWDDFGGYDFNQFLVSRERVHEAHPRSYYLHVAHRLQDLEGYRELKSVSSGKGNRSGGRRASPKGRRRGSARTSAPSRGRGGTRPGETSVGRLTASAASSSYFPRHPSTELFVSDRVDLTPRYLFNKGVCIWFEHLWHLIFGSAATRWRPRTERGIADDGDGLLVDVVAASGVSGGPGSSRGTRRVKIPVIEDRSRGELTAPVFLDPDHGQSTIPSTSASEIGRGSWASSASASPPSEVLWSNSSEKKSSRSRPTRYRFLSQVEIARRFPHRTTFPAFPPYTPNAEEVNIVDRIFSERAGDPNREQHRDDPEALQGAILLEKRRYLSHTRWDDASLPLALRDYVDSIQLHKYLLTPNETCVLLNKCMPLVRLRV